jgi:hypothetical protein
MLLVFAFYVRVLRSSNKCVGCARVHDVWFACSTTVHGQNGSKACVGASLVCVWCVVDCEVDSLRKYSCHECGRYLSWDMCVFHMVVDIALG